MVYTMYILFRVYEIPYALIIAGGTAFSAGWDTRQHIASFFTVTGNLPYSRIFYRLWIL